MENPNFRACMCVCKCVCECVCLRVFVTMICICIVFSKTIGLFLRCYCNRMGLGARQVNLLDISMLRPMCLCTRAHTTHTHTRVDIHCSLVPGSLI